MLSAVRMEPTVQSNREPSLSPSQPPIGARQTITSEKKIIVNPTRVGETFKIPWRKNGRRKNVEAWVMTTKKWLKTEAVNMRTLNNERSSSGTETLASTRSNNQKYKAANRNNVIGNEPKPDLAICWRPTRSEEH